MLDSIIKLKNGKSRKGFIFTLLALLVIAFMIIEVSIYFSTYQIRQESAPINIRTRIVEEFAIQLARPNVERATYISAYNAVHLLAQDSALYPVQTGTSTDNVTLTIESLILDGTRADGTQAGKVLISNGTLQDWMEGLKNISQTVGIYITIDCTNFTINQSDPWNVQVNYTFNYTLNDNYTKTNISDAYDVSVNVPITGSEDPLFKNQTGYTRYIFPYNGVVNVTKLFDASSNANGRGWFSGEIFKGKMVESSLDFNESDYSPENKKKILYISDYNIATNYGDMFGAVIYYGERYADIGSRVTVPFISILAPQSLSLSSIVLIKSGSDVDYATGNFVIYDVESVVDFIKCGSYIVNSKAPSFFDRLSTSIRSNPESRLLNESFGIETTIVGIGSWVTGSKSSVDYEYYYGTASSFKVMGTTGCKYFEMCKDTGSLTDLPRFRISVAEASALGLTDLVCSGSNAARCG